jgi:hypothetical protein
MFPPGKGSTSRLMPIVLPSKILEAATVREED